MTAKRTAKQQEPGINPPAQQGRNQLIIYCIIFIVGFLAGVAFTVYKSDPSAPVASSSTEEETHNHDNTNNQAILNLEAEVTANPKDYQAWTRLGNLYYDTQQPDKAIGAYTKSLELHKGDANILTDLGVMYRLTNQPQKAIEYFDRAMQDDPRHLPSRYNKGIVLMYDLSNPQGAIAAWEDLLRLDPQAKAGNGESIRALVDKIKAEQSATK